MKLIFILAVSVLVIVSAGHTQTVDQCLIDLAPPGATAADLTITPASETIEPKGTDWHGDTTLTLKVTAADDTAVAGATVWVTAQQASGTVFAEISPITLTTSNDGTATTTLSVNEGTGTVAVTASVADSDVEKTVSLPVALAPHTLSVTGISNNEQIESGESKTIRVTVTSKNGTPMPNLIVKFIDDDDSEIAFSPTTRTTDSSGEVWTTLNTGGEGTADFRIEVSDHASVYKTYTIEVVPTSETGSRHHTLSSEQGDPFDLEWRSYSYDFHFPGDVIKATVKWSVRLEDVGRARYKSSTFSGKVVTVNVELLEHWLEPNAINLTVTATYEAVADAPGAPALHPQFQPERLSVPITERPSETVLLPNYPNPFNPETWIPYRLATPANVTLHIYAADGTLVRTLALGHQPAGDYQRKDRAAYWDGRNAVGEPVASGIYFYTFNAGEFFATRKMLIMK